MIRSHVAPLPRASIPGYKNRVVVGDRINDIRVTRSFSGGGDNCDHARSAGRKGTVPDRRPHYRRSRSVQRADHVLACRDQMLWSARVHAKGREKAAGAICIKLVTGEC